MSSEKTKEKQNMKLWFICLISIFLCACFEDLSYPSTLVFDARVQNIPDQLNMLNLRIWGDDSIYLDTNLYKSTSDKAVFWESLSIDDYSDSPIKTITIEMEGFCDNGSFKFPKMNIALDNCYMLDISHERYILNKDEYNPVLENPETPCGKIDHWFYSIDIIPQLGNRDCGISTK